MLKVQVSFPELKAQAQAIRAMAQNPMTTLQALAGDLRPRFAEWMNDLMKAELALHLGRDLYERRPGSTNHRNGYRSRQFTVKGLGTLQLRIPRDREASSGISHTSILTTEILIGIPSPRRRSRGRPGRP